MKKTLLLHKTTEQTGESYLYLHTSTEIILNKSQTQKKTACMIPII